MSEFFPTAPENNTPATGWENMDPQSTTENPSLTFPEGTGFVDNQGTGDITPVAAEEGEPAAPAIFSANAAPAAEPSMPETPAAETPATESAEPAVFPEGMGMDAYAAEHRGTLLGDEVAAAESTETIPEATVTSEAGENKEATIRQAIADARAALDRLEAGL